MPHPWNMHNGDICFDQWPDNSVDAFNQMEGAIKEYLPDLQCELLVKMAALDVNSLDLTDWYHKKVRELIFSLTDGKPLYIQIASMSDDLCIVGKWATIERVITNIKYGEDSMEMVQTAKTLVRRWHPDKLRNWPPELATKISQYFNWVYKLLLDRREQYDAWLLHSHGSWFSPVMTCKSNWLDKWIQQHQKKKIGDLETQLQDEQRHHKTVLSRLECDLQKALHIVTEKEEDIEMIKQPQLKRAKLKRERTAQSVQSLDNRIRRMFADGTSYRQLADDFGLSTRQVRRIVSNK